MKEHNDDRLSLPCFCCGEELVNLDHRGNQPMGGLEMTSPGHYGCSVFDPMNATCLVINICDQCLIKNMDRAKVASPVTPVNVKFYTYSPFEPGNLATFEDQDGDD